VLATIGKIRAGPLRSLEVGKRGSPCSICRSKFRHQVEIGLTHGISAPVLAKRFALSRDAILRHSKNHLTPTQRAAILAAQRPSEIDLDALRQTESEGLLGHLVTQRARLQKYGDTAFEFGDVKGAVAVESAIVNNLNLTARLLGQLVQVHDVRHTSLLVSPDYLRMRAALVDALRPFPEAARAVGAALHRLESDAARNITNAGKPAPAVIEHQPVPPPPPSC
jgi:hypothetical protein